MKENEKEKRSFTPSQEEAISTFGSDVLVSAAAGSGKTTVLCERILRAIMNEDSPLDIRRMLVVTFTRSAAADLRRKLREKLIEAQREAPDKKCIRTAINRLSSARISTIDSFCYDLVKANFASLDLSPTVRIADESRTDELMEKLMDEAIRNSYDERGESFERLCDAFSSNLDDKLASKLCGFYKSLSSELDGIEALKKSGKTLAESDNSDFYKSVWGKAIIEYEKQNFIRYDALFESAIGIIQSDPEIAAARGDNIISQKELVGEVLRLIDREPQKCVSLVSSFDAGSVPNYKKTDRKSPEREWIETLRKDFASEQKKFIELLSTDERSVSQGAQALCESCDELYTLFSKFESAFDAEKKRLGLITFGDVERCCIDLLYDGGKPSALADEIANGFDCVFIDEYQDTNELQDAIFRAISRGNRFMVGDIKQSIYGFRGARPDLFASYREAFADTNEIAERDEIKGRKIFLSENFRSGERIIDFANAVCAPLFRCCSSFEYTNKDDLSFASKAPDGKIPVKINLFDKSGSCTEGEYLVASLRDMIEREGVSPSDIAIIVRTNSDATRASELLREAGIPYSVKKGSDFFARPEILLLVCLLNAIDNPTRDIYLAGALRSPLFAFTLDELAEIRSENKARSLYGSLTAKPESARSEKEKRFHAFLAEYRRAERTMTPDALIWRLFCEYSFIPTCCVGQSDTECDEIKRSLMRFFELARASSFSQEGALSSFLRYISRLMKNNTMKSSTSDGGTVRIMTVHDSKGLESPIVWMFASGKATKGERDDELCFDPELGLSMKPLCDDGYTKLESPHTKAATFKRTLLEIDEECRVLYVALTRAKERLIISATCSFYDDCEKLMTKTRLLSGALSRMTLAKEGKCYIKWILLALAASGRDDGTYEIVCNPEAPMLSAQVQECEKAEEEFSEEEYEKYASLIRERFDYRYPFERATKIPAKLSVSRLYPGIFDENTLSHEEESELDKSEKPSSCRPPKFILPERSRATGAERGTATHAFMQFCDFEKVGRDGVEAHLSSLVRDGYIGEEDARIVDIKALEGFFDSELYRKMKSARSMMRERRFLITLPASLFTSDDPRSLESESVLVQGVVDCCFEDADKEVWLVDYKTDRADPSLDRESAKALLRERHKTQLHYYRVALERILKKEISHTVLYSFALGDTVEIE